MANRGISTIISVILLVALTLVIAGSAFYFIQTLQQRSQGQTSGAEDLLRTRLASCLELRNADYDVDADTLNLTVKNCGSRNLDLNNSLVRIEVIDSGSCNFALVDAGTCLDGCDALLGVSSFGTLSVDAAAAGCNVTLDGATGLSTYFELTLQDNTLTASTTFIP